MNTNFFVCLIMSTLLFNISFSQELTGKVIDVKGNGISEAIIKANGVYEYKKILTSKDGVFKIKLKDNDTTLNLNIYKYGYKEVTTKIKTTTKKTVLITLIVENLNELDEVVISANSTVHNSNKTTYRVNYKEYGNNTKTDKVLKSLPGITITEQGLLMDNQRLVTVFIDGIESDIEEIKQLDVKSVKSIEVTTNPSASYGTEILGGVINIISQTKKERYFKGSFESFTGLRLNLFGVVPSISFKSKHITFSSFYSWVNNEQFIETNIERTSSTNSLKLKSNRDVNGWQDYLVAKLRILLSKKSNLNIRGNISKYDLKSITNGRYNSINSINDFRINSSEKLKKYFASSVYQHNYDKDSKLIAKYKFFDYTVNNNHNYIEESTQLNNKVLSSLEEHSTEILFDRKISLKRNINFSIGNKNIFRKYFFNNSELNLKQNINNLFIDTDVLFSNNFSIFSSLVYDISRNKGKMLNQKYDYLLPTVSVIYKFSTKSNIKVEFSKKITRPNPENLNSIDIYFNPSYILRGNSTLLPQTRNYYQIRYFKRFDNNSSIFIKPYIENIFNGIVKSFEKENNTVLTKYENAGKINSYGINIGFNGKLLKDISLNVNTGINYNQYETNDKFASIVKRNEGFSFNSSIYLYTLFKNGISLSLSAFYNNPNYNLITTTYKNPVLSFDAEKSIFKEKLTVRLSYTDLFGLSTETTNKIRYDEFFQKSTIQNKITNLSVTLVYNFGKTFSTRYHDPMINNEDLKLKKW